MLRLVVWLSRRGSRVLQQTVTLELNVFQVVVINVGWENTKRPQCLSHRQRVQIVPRDCISRHLIKTFLSVLPVRQEDTAI